MSVVLEIIFPLRGFLNLIIFVFHKIYIIAEYFQTRRGHWRSNLFAVRCSFETKDVQEHVLFKGKVATISTFVMMSDDTKYE